MSWFERAGSPDVRWRGGSLCERVTRFCFGSTDFQRQHRSSLVLCLIVGAGFVLAVLPRAEAILVRYVD